MKSMKKTAMRKKVILAMGVMVIEKGIAGLAWKKLCGVENELVRQKVEIVYSSFIKASWLRDRETWTFSSCTSAHFSSTQVKKLKLPVHARDNNRAVDGRQLSLAYLVQRFQCAFGGCVGNA